MRIIGCDLHARQQSVAMLDTETGEVVNRTLMHEGSEVREFYFQLPHPVLVGIEAIGPMQWFLRLLEELGIDCQVGDATKIRAAEPRKQKHDRRDAELILKLLVENRFPAIWRPSQELLDLRALLLHRHHWVRLRTQIQNALQAIALANGLRRGPSLWSYDGQAKIAFLPLPPHASYRRSMLQALYRKMEEEIQQLTVQVAEQAEQRAGARLLLTHPGVGPVTALATDVFLGDPRRFADGKALASYVGLIPREYSSGAHQRLGPLTNKAVRSYAFFGMRLPLMRCVVIQSCSGSIVVSWCRKDWGNPAWPRPASWGFACGSCCAIRSIMKSSVAADRSKAVPPVRGCLKSRMVRTVTVRLIRLPASLRRRGVRISHHGPQMTEEIVGGSTETMKRHRSERKG